MLVLAVLVTLELSIGKDADRVIPEEPTTAPTSDDEYYEGLLMNSSTRDPSMEPTSTSSTREPSMEPTTYTLHPVPSSRPTAVARTKRTGKMTTVTTATGTTTTGILPLSILIALYMEMSSQVARSRTSPPLPVTEIVAGTDDKTANEACCVCGGGNGNYTCGTSDDDSSDGE